MPATQRGATNVGVALALSVSLGGIIFILTAIAPLQHWRKALAISKQLRHITEAATLSYRQGVMQSRCLTQTNTMTLSRLISEQRLPIDINQGLQTFEVKLIDLPINGWTRPSQIQTTVTFQSLADLHAVIDNLPAGKVDNLSLTVSTPLHIDITDNWAHFNKQTGCYE
ncbi:hypothetical protein [Shewanella colwelliana]|uniref:hypothetical protein n=1 Tax=Shewanella colwelliana TaxID=23 RepID=UPI0037370164